MMHYVVVVLLGLFLAKVINATEIENACGEITVATLFAGQHIDSGSVSVFNTEDKIVVIYQTSGAWQIDEYHLEVVSSLAEVPQTKKGNPKNGQFTYGGTFSTPMTTITLELPIGDYEEGDSLVVAAHAALSGQGSESAWADGFDFPGSNWATYIDTAVQACETVIVDPPVMGCVWTADYWVLHAFDSPFFRDPAWDSAPESVNFFASMLNNLEVISSLDFSDAFLILGREYLTTLLNDANGASQPAVVQEAFVNAFEWLNMNSQNTDPSSLAGQEALALQSVLSSYNNGLLSPFLCLEDED